MTSLRIVESENDYGKNVHIIRDTKAISDKELVLMADRGNHNFGSHVERKTNKIGIEYARVTIYID